MRKYKLCINNNNYEAEVQEITLEKASVVVNGQEYQVQIKDFIRSEDISPIKKSPEDKQIEVKKQAPESMANKKLADTNEGVCAPLPGSIMKVMVVDGQSVRAGQDLIIMEAMKMENNIQAPYDGTVKKIFVNPGDSVAESDLLVEIARPLMTTL